MVTTTRVSRGAQIIFVAELTTSWVVLTKRYMHLIFTSIRSEGMVSSSSCPKLAEDTNLYSSYRREV